MTLDVRTICLSVPQLIRYSFKSETYPCFIPSNKIYLFLYQLIYTKNSCVKESTQQVVLQAGVRSMTSSSSKEKIKFITSIK
jgi:hypothetical protein